MKTLLRKEDLGAFGEFLETRGYVTTEPVGDYEVLRALGDRLPKILVFRSERRPSLTVSKTGKDLFQKFQETQTRRSKIKPKCDVAVTEGNQWRVLIETPPEAHRFPDSTCPGCKLEDRIIEIVNEFMDKAENGS